LLPVLTAAEIGRDLFPNVLLYLHPERNNASFVVIRNFVDGLVWLEGQPPERGLRFGEEFYRTGPEAHVDVVLVY